MSRIRSIHPGFFTDESFVQVSAHARLLLLGLGVEADDKGTFPWKPVTLKMRLFPMDVVDIQELLQELCQADAIRRYMMDGKEYAAIRNFRLHQRPKKPNDINPMPVEFGIYVGLTPDSSPPVPHQFGKTSADGEEGRMEDGEEGSNPIAPLVSETVLKAFRAHRIKLKAPLTPHAEKLILKKLEEFQSKHGHDPTAVIEQSIERGWKGIFELKGDDYGNRSRNGGSGLFNACSE